MSKKNAVRVVVSTLVAATSLAGVVAEDRQNQAKKSAELSVSSGAKAPEVDSGPKLVKGAEPIAEQGVQQSEPGDDINPQPFPARTPLDVTVQFIDPVTGELSPPHEAVLYLQRAGTP